MAHRNGLIEPPIEELLARVDSKFSLVTVAARRARQINAYYQGLGDGLGAMVPPQVASTASKPLSVALEEIVADKIEVTRRNVAAGEVVDAVVAEDGAAAGVGADPAGVGDAAVVPEA